MVELTTRQEAKVLTFANKAFTKISALADDARLEDNKRKRREIVRSGKKLAKYLIAIDDSRNQWQANSLMLTIDNLINEYDLFEVPVNPSQLNINDLTTRILGETGGDGSGNVTTTQLNAEAAARIAADNTLQTNIDTVDQRVTNLDFSGLVPETVVFSEATPGFKDFPTELGISFPNKSVLDNVTAQNLTDIGLNNTHRNNGDIHVTLAQKNDWNSRVTSGELTTALSGKANTNHVHTIGQINNLQAELDALAQSILDNAAEDGVTPSISIGSVTSGTTASVTLGAGSTAANPILDFVLVPGDKGDQGDPFEFGAIDFLANRSNYINEAFSFSFVDVQTGLVYYKQAGAGTDTWSGGIRTIGDRGWTPVHVLEPIDGKAYLKLVDYIDGQGVKPTQNIGAYVGPTGYVLSPLAATNLKGNQGPAPVPGVDYEIPRFKIDTTSTYSQYLADASTLLSSQPIGYTIQFEGSVSPYENKNGQIAILSRNATTGAREWREYEFQGEQGPAGVPGPKGDPGADGADGESLLLDFVPDASYIEGSAIKRDGKVRVIKSTVTFPYSSATFVEADWDTVGGSDLPIEQTRSQSTTAVPSSKLLDDELTSLQNEISNVDTGGLWNGGELVFDKDKTIFKQQDGDLVLSLASSGNKNARSIILTINGNNLNTLTIPNNFRNLNGGQFDNSKLNIISLTFVEQIGSTELVYYSLNTTAALDNVGPVIQSFILENSNTYVDVTFDEGVYTNLGADQPIVSSDFQVLFNANGGEATNVTISAVTKTDNTALTGGEFTVRCVLNITGDPVGVETINIQVASGSAIYDSFGNPANASEATGEIALRGNFSTSYINVLNKANERGNTKPLIADQEKEDTFISTLFDNGILDKSLILYNLKTGGDAGFSQINWADPNTFDIETIGTPVFNTKQGWRTNGSGNALNTKWIKGTNFNGNLSLHVKTTEMGQQTLAQPMGARISSGARILIQPWNNGGQFSAAGGGSLGVLEENVTESNTFMSVTFDGTNARLYKNGVLINTIALTNTQNITLELYLLAYNNGGTPFGFIPDTVDLEFAAVTEFLTDTECSTLYNAWNTYNTAL